MPFYLDPAKLFRSTLLDVQPWLRHGFGTTQSTDWPGETATLQQIHSDLVLLVAASSCHGEQGEGDALVTREPGAAISIRTADCVPLLFADPVQRAVAAVHAGWKGTALKIARKTVERMSAEFGTRAEDLIVAIGPAIGACCYEVGQDVARQLAASPVPEGKSHIDLAAINRAQLEEAGVANIDMLEVCTKCSADLCHSFRRDGEQSGRMHTAIGILL